MPDAFGRFVECLNRQSAPYTYCAHLHNQPAGMRLRVWNTCTGESIRFAWCWADGDMAARQDAALDAAMRFMRDNDLFGFGRQQVAQ